MFPCKYFSHIPYRIVFCAKEDDPCLPGPFLFGREHSREVTLSQDTRTAWAATAIRMNLARRNVICCGTTQVSLPPKDDTLAPGIFGEGTPGPRWYDFTNAPDVEGFDASSCPAGITWGGREAFHLFGCERRGRGERSWGCDCFYCTTYRKSASSTQRTLGRITSIELMSLW